MLALARVAADLGLRGTIAADNDGYPGILGYRGPALSDVTRRVGADSSATRSSRCSCARARPRSSCCARAAAGARTLIGLLEQYTRVGSTEARGEPARPAGDDARDARGARLTRAARLRRRRQGGLPRPDRPAQLVGARGRAQHRVRSRRRARHGDGCAGLGLPGGARARARHRPADRPHAVAVRPHARFAGGGIRGDRAGRDVRRRRRRRHGLLRASTTSSATGASTPGTARASETTRRRSWTSATRRRSSRAWSSRSSRASTTRRSAASVTPTRSS